MIRPILGLFNLGGGEIVLILVLLSVLVLAALAILGMVFLILYCARKWSPRVPPSIQTSKS
jgi:hypothetical protein